MDWTIPAVILTIIAGVAGWFIVNWGKSAEFHGEVVGKEPILKRWFDSREDRFNDTLRRVERLEDRLMEKK